MAWDETAICSGNPEFGGRGNPKQGDDYGAAPNIDHSQVCEQVCAALPVQARPQLRQGGFGGPAASGEGE